MYKYQVYRGHSSSYQSKDFFDSEKKSLESIPNVRYVTTPREISPDEHLILLTNTHVKTADIPPNLLAKTVLMVHPNSGHDNFSYNFVKEQKYPIVTGNQIRAHAVAEYILSCLFHHFTTLPEHYHWSEFRTWPRKLIHQKNIFMLGYGEIGKILAPALSALGQKLTIYDPYNRPQIPMNNFYDQISDHLISDADILILACNLNQDNKGIINMPFLKKLPPEFLLINAARGEIISEKDLLEFAKTNPRNHFYLDVFENEPFSSQKYNDLKNIKKTSHIAGVYQELNNEILKFEEKIIRDFVYAHDNKNTENFYKKYKNQLLNNKEQKDFLH